MADNIGSLSILLGLDSSPFAKGASDVLGKAMQMGKSVGSALGAMGAAAGTILEGKIGKGVNMALEQMKGIPAPITAALDGLSQIPGPVGAIATGAKAAVGVIAALKDVSIGFLQTTIDMAVAGMARIREQSRMARQFGMSMGSAAGLQLLSGQVGQDPNELAGGFFHLNRAIAQARGGNVETQASFRNLGVSMEQIRAGDNAAIFSQISASVRENGDAVQNTNRLSEVFGRRGVASMNALLYQEGDALSEATERAQRYGLVVSEEDARMVTSANRARQRMASDWQALWQGLETRLGVAFAPAWQSIAEGFQRVATMAEPFFGAIREFIDTIGRGVGQFTAGVTDGLEKFAEPLGQAMRAFGDIAKIVGEILFGSEGAEDHWFYIGQLLAGTVVLGVKMVAGLVLAVAEGFLQVWEAVRGMVQALDVAIIAAKRFYNTVRQTALNLLPEGPLRDAAANMWGPALEETSTMASGIRDMTAELERVQAARARLDAPVEGWLSAGEWERMTGEARELERISRRTGTGGLDSDAFQRQTREMQQQYEQITRTAAAYHRWQLERQGANDSQIRQADELFRANERAREFYNNLDPLERYQRELERIQELYADTGDLEGYQRALGRVAEQFDRATGGQGHTAVSAMAEGSREAQSAINRSRQEEDNPQARMEAALLRGATAQERTAQVNAAIYQWLVDTGQVEAVDELE